MFEQITSYLTPGIAIAAALGLLCGIVLQAVITTSIRPVGTFAIGGMLERVLLWAISGTVCGGITYWLWSDLSPPAMLSVSVVWGFVSPLSHAVLLWLAAKRWPGLLRSVERHTGGGDAA